MNKNLIGQICNKVDELYLRLDPEHLQNIEMVDNLDEVNKKLDKLLDKVKEQ